MPNSQNFDAINHNLLTEITPSNTPMNANTLSRENQINHSPLNVSLNNTMTLNRHSNQNTYSIQEIMNNLSQLHLSQPGRNSATSTSMDYVQLPIVSQSIDSNNSFRNRRSMSPR